MPANRRSDAHLRVCLGSCDGVLRALSLLALATALPIGTGIDLGTSSCSGDLDAQASALAYGLDARPVNATCVAWTRPEPPGREVSLIALFPTQYFVEPVQLLRRRLDPADATSWRWLVVEWGGVVRLVTNDVEATSTVFLDLSDKLAGSTESGLAGIAFEPGYSAKAGPPSHSRVFVSSVRKRDAAALGCAPSRGGARACRVLSVLDVQSTDGGASFTQGPETVLATISEDEHEPSLGCLAFSSLLAQMRERRPTLSGCEARLPDLRRSGATVSGGSVYHGAAMPAYAGFTFFTDSVEGALWAVATGNAEKLYLAPERVAHPPGMFVSLSEDERHELYVVDRYGAEGETIFRLESAPAEEARVPRSLTATGCVDVDDPREPAAGVIPLTLRAPAWWDGARVERFLATPEGTAIHIESSGQWQMPRGSVLMQSFYLGERVVETRLLVRHTDGGWAGYAYVWDEEQTNAYLTTGHEERESAGRRWRVPAPSECLECHSGPAGGIGLETAQLDATRAYEGGRRAGQLATLAHIGLLDAPPVAPPFDLPALVDPLSSAPSPERARAYLHANCAHCHQPNGAGAARSPVDLRYDTPFAQMHVCDERPAAHLTVAGEPGWAGARLLSPGLPERSLLYLLPASHDVEARMPPLASDVPDEAALALLGEWIAEMQGCP